MTTSSIFTRNRHKWHTVVFAVGFLFANLSAYAQFASIGMQGSPCVGSDVQYYIMGSNCSGLSWSVSNGTITSGQGTNLIHVTYSSATNSNISVSGTCNGSFVNPTYTATIGANVTPAVSLALSTTNVCVGSSITFTATPTNGGTPSYSYYVHNGSTASLVGSGSSASFAYSTAGLAAGSYNAYVVMSSSITCVTSSTATSTWKPFTVTAISTFSASVSGPGQICSADPNITVFASPTGANYEYQWYNGSFGNPVGTRSATNNRQFTGVTNGQVIYVRVFDIAACGGQADSGPYTVSITNSTTPTVSIQVNKTSFCSGETLNLSANVTAASYVWRLSGTQFSTSASTTLPVSTDTNAPNTFSPGDVITLDVTGITGFVCPTTTSGSASSSGIPFVINPMVTPSVSLTNPGSVCNPATVVLTATATNGGSSPTYQFFLDGTSVQNTSSNTYSVSALTAGSHSTYVIVTSNAVCLTQTTATSSTQTFTVADKATFTTTITPPAIVCSGLPSGTWTSSVTGAVGNLSYQWYKNSATLSGQTGSTLVNPTVANNDQIQLKVSSDYWCVNSPSTSNTHVISLTASTTPTATINVSPTTYCSGSPINLSVSSPQSLTGVSYAWKLNSTAYGGNAQNVQVTSSFSPGTNLYSPGSSMTIRVSNFSGTCLTQTFADATAPSLTINPLPPSPAAPTVTLLCNSSFLSRATPVAGTTWYWQGTNPNGTDISAGAMATSYTTSTAGTFYLRPRYDATSCWGSAVGTSVTVVNTPAAPPNPVAGDNIVCGSSFVYKSTAPSGVTYFWQGTNSSGQDNSSLVATAFEYNIPDQNTVHYIAARADALNCWSASTPFSLADMPSELVLSSYTAGTTLAEATSRVRLVPGFTVTAGQNFTARTSTTVCNDQMNWRETITYDQTGAVVGDTRVYLNGSGSELQSQSKDIVSGRILATQPLLDRLGASVGATLPAPILEANFVYKNGLLSNSTGTRYTTSDFDQPITLAAAAGEVFNPKAVGTQAGTVGWYYSSNNTDEPLTATTQYPYGRSYTPAGPDPTVNYSAGAGNAFRMGATHESKSERFSIEAGVLDQYYTLRPFFVSTPVRSGTNLLGSLSTTSTAGFSSNQNATVTAENGYIKVVSTTTGGNPGVYPIGTVPVTPGQYYNFSIKGYAANGSHPPSMWAKIYLGADLSWTPLPVGTDSWVSSSFQIPAGATSLVVGVVWPLNSVVGDTFYLSGFELHEIGASATSGYKYVATDPNGKRVASFVDAAGTTLATALVTSAPGASFTYDYWSYSYYNDVNQLVATVAPKDIPPGFTLPTATTYRYDHFGRLIESYSPDEGTSQYVYALDGRIRFSQNQLQRNATPKRFSYTNYDYLGRLIESGEYTQGTFVFEPQYTATPAGNSVLNASILENTGFSGTSGNLESANCADVMKMWFDVQQPDFVADGTHPSQLWLNGQVSKTSNANATTWYSYNEDGSLAWTKQKIAGFSTKFVDYTYDYFGNATRVAYQAGAADAFYHHYSFDANQRLLTVSTSLDGTTTTQHAKYKYYLHGPLKRVELAQNLQGIDYVYNVDGSLKSINNSDKTKDPGQDGVANGFSADLFGQTYSYFDGDYNGAGYNAGQITNVGATDQFNGLQKAASWFTPIDNLQSTRVYKYSYESRDQFQNALFGTVTYPAGVATAAFPDESYREGIPSYDKNGNILQLIRKGKNAASIANYTYNYLSSTNKLASVTGGTNSVNFTYNTIGQMTQQAEGSSTKTVVYNARGLVSEMGDGTYPVLKYYYDDRGSLVKKVYYVNNVVKKTTFIVSDAGGQTLAIYDSLPSSPMRLSEVPLYGAGRLGVFRPRSTSPVCCFFYELDDHLGNVRAVVGPPRTEVQTATMETETMANEDKVFKNIAPRVPWVNGTVTPPAPAGNEAVRLNSSRPVGPAIVLKVAPGDVISAEVYAYYEGCTDCSNTLPLSSIVTATAAAFGGSPTGLPDQIRVYNGVNNVLSGGFGGVAGSSTNAVPAAYLNMITFNNNLDLPDPSQLPMAAIPVSASANMQKQKLSFGPITFTAPGYAYIYLSDNSNSTTYVYFDDLKVTQLHSPYVAGSDFYPFGLTMSDRDILAEPYRYGYQGQYAKEDSVSGWNAFDLRMYDARFGRWLSPDPYGQFASPYMGMGNSPVTGTDPDGGWCCGSVAEALGDREVMFLSELYAIRPTTRTPLFAGTLQSSIEINLQDFGGSFPDYQLKYPEFLSMTPKEAYQYWLLYYSQEFNRKWRENLKQERGREAVEKMKTFAGRFELMSYVVAPGAGVYLPATKQFMYLPRGVQYTKSTLQLGQKMHKAYKAGDVIEGIAEKEFREISGIRPDFVDFRINTIFELKPFNPRAMKQGWDQLAKYKKLFEQKYGGTWNIHLDTY